jgi:transcriptional regulator with XRE-family HTH domain
MTAAAQLVRSARRGRGLSQRRLAELSGRAQSEISRLERGRRDAGVELVERLVHGAGQTLVLVPTRKSPVTAHADTIGSFVEAGQPRRAWRAAIQLADDLAAEHGAVRVALTVAPPPPTGDARFDALVAGIVEYRLNEEALPHPEWLDQDGGAPLEAPWSPDGYVPATPEALAVAPGPFRRRGIVLSDADLVSV